MANIEGVEWSEKEKFDVKKVDNTFHLRMNGRTIARVWNKDFAEKILRGLKRKGLVELSEWATN